MSLQKSKLLSLSKLNKAFPKNPGIYIFCNSKKIPLYVGKAISLYSRVNSYFSKALFGKTKAMIKEAKYISFIITNSELEALLLEAKMVKKLNPKYNILLKDDKHPLYIRITKEIYPRILTARKIDTEGNFAFFGPFPSTYHVKHVLRILRRIFPYSNHIVGKRPCLNMQTGLCNPCPSYIANLEYKDKISTLKNIYMNNIYSIKRILSTNINKVLKDLYKEMDFLSKKEKYEEAIEIKKRIDSLEYITQSKLDIGSFIQNPNLVYDIRKQEIGSLKKLILPYITIKKLNRLECFDIAHLSGNYATASMVVFINGESDKFLYRHFRLKGNINKNDLYSLEQIIKRRINRFNDWGKPDLIIVDGGILQTSVFIKALKLYKIPIVGIAKEIETLIVPKKIDNKLIFNKIILPDIPAKYLIQRIRNEAHRFAQKYHHYLVKKYLIP